MGNNLAEEYKANAGLRQGWVLLTLLFNKVLEWIPRKMERVEGLHFREQMYTLAYADYVDLITGDIDFRRILQSFV